MEDKIFNIGDHIIIKSEQYEGGYDSGTIMNIVFDSNNVPALICKRDSFKGDIPWIIIYCDTVEFIDRKNQLH